MSQWEQVLKAPNDVQKRVASLYGNSFPLEVRIYLAKIIEDNILADNCNENDPAFEQNAIKFFELIKHELDKNVVEVEALSHFRLQASLVELQHQNVFAVVRLYSYLRKCLITEQQLILSGQQPPPNSDPEQVEISATIRQLLSHVADTVASNKQITHEYETFAINYRDNVTMNTQLQHDINAIAEHNARNEFAFNRFYPEIGQLESKIQKTLILTKSVLGKVVSKYLLQWKMNQCLAGNGAHYDDTLNMLQDWFGNLAEIIWSTREEIKKACKTLVLFPVQSTVKNLLPQCQEEATHLLSNLITNAFIIEKQPPQVVRTGTKFPTQTSVRLLIGSKLNIHMTTPTVKVTIVSDTQAQAVQTENKVSSMSSGEILNNTNSMQFSESQRTLIAHFSNLQIKSIKSLKRADRKGVANVTDEKFALLFQSTFQMGHSDLVYKVWALSVPIVVTVHCSQDCHSWATITWDNAFAVISRIPFQVPDKVPWLGVAEMLSNKFSQATEKPLSEMNIRALCDKMFNQPNMNCDHLEVTWSHFCKELIPDRSFAFWDWFYAVMKLTREHLRPLWKDNLIMGFVHKKTAEEMLLQCPPGTFLLRFSDSQLSAVTITFVGLQNGAPQIIMLEPFVVKDLAARALADRIQDLPQLVTLYPNIPKHQAFGKYFTPPPKPVGKNDGYTPSGLKAEVLIPPPPIHNVFQSSQNSNDMMLLNSNRYGSPDVSMFTERLPPIDFGRNCNYDMYEQRSENYF